MGEPVLGVGNWPAFFDLLQHDSPTLSGAKQLLSQFTEVELAALKKAGEEYAPAIAAEVAAEQKRKDAEADAKKADSGVRPAAEAALKAANTAIKRRPNWRKRC